MLGDQSWRDFYITLFPETIRVVGRNTTSIAFQTVSNWIQPRQRCFIQAGTPVHWSGYSLHRVALETRIEPGFRIGNHLPLYHRPRNISRSGFW